MNKMVNNRSIITISMSYIFSLSISIALCDCSLHFVVNVESFLMADSASYCAIEWKRKKKKKWKKQLLVMIARFPRFPTRRKWIALYVSMCYMHSIIYCAHIQSITKKIGANGSNRTKQKEQNLHTYDTLQLIFDCRCFFLATLVLGEMLSSSIAAVVPFSDQHTHIYISKCCVLQSFSKWVNKKSPHINQFANWFDIYTFLLHGVGKEEKKWNVVNGNENERSFIYIKYIQIQSNSLLMMFYQ